MSESNTSSNVPDVDVIGATAPADGSNTIKDPDDWVTGINVHVSRPNIRISMVRDREVLKWRALAKDGMELPPDQTTERPSDQQVGNGETYDFEFVPTAAGENLIEVRSGVGVFLASMPFMSGSADWRHQHERAEMAEILSAEFVDVSGACLAE